MPDPVRQIQPVDVNLPPLALPPGALPDVDAAAGYDVDDDPPQIEPVEHRIRVDFMQADPIRRDQLLDEYSPWNHDPGDQDPWAAAGIKKPLGVRYAETTCADTWEEEKQIFEQFGDGTGLAQAPPYLAARLRAVRTGEAALEEERSNRRAWYQKLIPWQNLYQVCKRETFGSLLPGPVSQESVSNVNQFVGMVIVSDATDPDQYARQHDIASELVQRESDLTAAGHENLVHPSEYGIGLPAPLLVGDFHSGSQYVLIPWSDGLVCSCPYKHEYPWRVLCKHELCAAIIAGEADSVVLPVDRGVAVPQRARRLVNPRIARRHTPEISTPR